MRIFKLLSIFVSWLFFIAQSIHSQTIIFSNSGASYNNTDAVTTDTYGPADVSNCSSISFSIDYNFSLPYGGPFNMESSDECPFGIPPCQGDPNDPDGGGCNQCWDFFYVQFQVDGNTVNTKLVGVPGNTNQSGTLTFVPICTNGAANAGFVVQTQTWAADETITFSNLKITCWDASASSLAVSPDPACEGQAFVLTATLTDPPGVASTLWAGPGAISTPTNLNTSVNNAPVGSNTYTFTATDDNACTSSSTITVTVNQPPTMDNIPNITVCAEDQVDIAFTGFGNLDYNWSNSNTAIGLDATGSGDISFTALSDPTPWVIGTITVVPSENGCIGQSQSFTISTRPLPILFPHSDSTYCEGEWIYVWPQGIPDDTNIPCYAGAIVEGDNPSVWQTGAFWLPFGVGVGQPSPDINQQEIVHITLTPSVSGWRLPNGPYNLHYDH